MWLGAMLSRSSLPDLEASDVLKKLERVERPSVPVAVFQLLHVNGSASCH